jgi:hypothetical protein
MMTSNPQKNIASEILARVHKGECKQRPRWYFVMRLVVWIALLLTLAASVAILASFIFFGEYVSGEHCLLSFGWRGFMVFMSILPWPLILVEITLIVLLEVAVRRFVFGYRAPILYLFAGLVAVGTLIAALINATPIHTMLLEKARKHDLPIIGEWYEHIHVSHESEGVFRGVIISVASSSFIMAHNDFDNDADDGVRLVILPNGISDTAFTIGDKVIVAGDATNTVIQAYGIERRR